MVFRGVPVRLTAERWEDLKAVNKTVNAAIIPERNTAGLAGEKWLIGPARGDCNYYAVTKRSELLERGWPTRALLLSDVVTAWGEHYLGLVVRASVGDLVLDNMTPQIRPRAPYQWVRIQTPRIRTIGLHSALAMPKGRVGPGLGARPERKLGTIPATNALRQSKSNHGVADHGDARM